MASNVTVMSGMLGLEARTGPTPGNINVSHRDYTFRFSALTEHVDLCWWDK